MSVPFKHLIRQIRKSHGLSQAEFAKRLDLSSGQIVSNWERDYGSEMSVETLKKIIARFDVSSTPLFESYVMHRKDRLHKKIKNEWESS